jgi:ABC-2 type transport system ATP-binding protein
VRTLAGLLEPSAGEVRVEGADPHHEPEAERARARMALVPDNPVLYGDLTVREHVELVTVAHGLAGSELGDRIDALLDRLGLAHRSDFRPPELSRGMRQKTQLACALIRPTALLLLDEPVVGLDPPSQALLHELLLERKAAGCAVLLTTHQMRFAEGLADRGVLLSEGEVTDSGSYRDVAANAAEAGWEIA